jgi:subtilisin family serine protease
MAMGSSVVVIESTGQIIYSNGTSFSTPILAGLSACLWQALPELTSFEMIQLLQQTANAFSYPDSLIGYGIADVYKAYTQTKTGLEPLKTEDVLIFSVNPYENRLYLNLDHSQNESKLVLDIYSGVGIKVLSVHDFSSSIDISSLPKGIYIARLQMRDKPAYVRKFIKF